MVVRKKKERVLVQTPKKKNFASYHKPSAVIKAEDNRNPFERVQNTLYLYVWVKEQLDEKVENGEFANFSRGIEHAVIAYYGLKKPVRSKKAR